MSECVVEQRDLATVARSLLALDEQALRGEIQRLMARVPLLSSNGLGRSLTHADDAHQRARSVLASSEGERQVRRALTWLACSGVRATSVAKARASSYDAKHRAERWLRVVPHGVV